MNDAIIDLRRRGESDGQRHELLTGDIVTSSVRSQEVQRAARNIGFALEEWLEESGGGDLYYDPFLLYLSEEDILQADLLWILDPQEGTITSDFLQGLPALLVDISTPETPSPDGRMEIYARHGISEVWWVNMEKRTISRYQPKTSGSTPTDCFQDSETLTSEQVPGFSLPVSDIFA